MDRRTLNGTAQTGNLRGLKALVIGMGVLIVLGTSLVIGLVIKRFYDVSGGSAKPFGAAIHIPAQAGAVIGGVAAVDGRLAVWVKEGGAGRIVLIDPRSGAVAGTVTLSSKPLDVPAKGHSDRQNFVLQKETRMDRLKRAGDKE